MVLQEPKTGRSDMPENEFAHLEETFLSDAASVHASHLYEYERAHNSLAVSKYGRGVKQFEDYFEVISQIVFATNYEDKSNWPERKSFQYLLSRYAALTLWRVFRESMDGYYSQASCLGRTGLETTCRIIFLSLHQNSARSLFPRGGHAGGSKQRGSRPFKIDSLLSGDLKVNWKDLIETTSWDVHGYQFEMASDYFAAHRGTIGAIVVRPKYDEPAFSRPFNLSFFLAHLLLTTLDSIFVQSSGKAEPVVTAEFAERVKRCRSMLYLLQKNSKNRYAQSADEVERVGRILVSAEREEDWKKVR